MGPYRLFTPPPRLAFRNGATRPKSGNKALRRMATVRFQKPVPLWRETTEGRSISLTRDWKRAGRSVHFADLAATQQKRRRKCSLQLRHYHGQWYRVECISRVLAGYETPLQETLAVRARTHPRSGLRNPRRASGLFLHACRSEVILSLARLHTRNPNREL
jgi:hypothetical protein